MIDATITFWFVLVCALVHLGLGFVWYSPFVFGNEWARLSGKAGNPLDVKDVSVPLLWSAGSAIVLAYALGTILAAFAPQSLYECISIAILAWLGLSAATNVGEYVFQKKPLVLFLINSGYSLTSFLIIAVLFRLWH